MNIIAFVLGLLMIFAITTSTLFKKSISENIATKSFSGFMVASRDANNKAVDQYYENIKQKPEESSSKKQKNDSKKEQKPKTRDIKPENAKINIYPLIEGNENKKELYNIVVKLIKTLYWDKKFYKKNFEYTLLNNILNAFEKQLKNDTNIGLANLVLKNSSDQKVYYKILKGTKFYNFESKIGIASLLDFIKYENATGKIPIKDASYELLKSIFNKNIAKEIEVLQKHNPPKNLTHSNLLEICQKYRYEIDEDILNLFDFSNSIITSKDKIIVGIDQKTNIKVKKKFN